MKPNNTFANIILWVARISGSLLVVFNGGFFIMVFLDGRLEISSINQIFIGGAWGIALSGLVIALWKEGLGGCISLVSFVILSIKHMFIPLADWVSFLIMGIPALFYIFNWFLTKNLLLKTDVKQLEEIK